MLRMMQGLVRPPVLKRAALLGAILVCCLTCAGCMGQNGGDSAPSEIKGDESLMSQKGHGTCRQAVMRPLRWGANWGKADEVCCFNRHYAESAGSWQSTSFPAALATAGAANQEITFYDSVTGKPLFRAPRGRSAGDFQRESSSHGWPSFRDEEVVKENVRVLPDGETVSVDGTHLGHNLPDGSGNRYCINLVSVAGESGQAEL
ncbi:unnamed protein product [Polarella glacialis]|uniref:Peptide-methionine (R)-S-oxide reductase n=1 Tax=Polarella glacialis TaxID=89957 RepID=A0A813EEG5_POLGL|nr:unnamed protein product [Polarella glacialis]